MGAFKPNGGSSAGGITPAQLALLASAAGLTAATATLEGDISTARTGIENRTISTAGALEILINARAETVAAEAAKAAPRMGEVRKFLSANVPANFSPLQAITPMPVGGALVVGQGHTTQGGAAVVVEAGPGAGLWRYTQAGWAKFDLLTNVAASGYYPCPTLLTSVAGSDVGAVAIGSKIYYGGCSSGAIPASTAALYVFDTATLTHTALASFPRALGGSLGEGVRAVALPDGRILFAASKASGLTITQSAMPLWIYDPATGAAPVEVIVSLPTATFAVANSDIAMVVLPSGNVLVMDSIQAAPVSCVLTITGTAIAVGPAISVNLSHAAPQNSILLATLSGALFYNSASWAAFVEGSGWTTSARPFAYGVLPAPGMRSARTSFGHLLTGGYNAGAPRVSISILFAGTPVSGSTTTEAYRTV